MMFKISLKKTISNIAIDLQTDGPFNNEINRGINSVTAIVYSCTIGRKTASEACFSCFSLNQKITTKLEN